ncbi:site-specific DNA-methyltransferase (adenine-specific) [Gracilibacillus halotolerans]|uniref:Site-specific DNA-methyltransferase (Adenine-specific) n=1 Tax=Gracilibacillus halotolerans TaxID=74386 RepID=A0A841RRE3_9BACI|nr:class I SAM-dependent methyltransferase [Gracilibacillus halotolerans]MBB6513926.1 site-specific DNA-methyltransferase (adenine-specific) [Gracilibacillus halotolerans]
MTFEVEKAFYTLDKLIETYMEANNEPYLDSLSIVMQSLQKGEVPNGVNSQSFNQLYETVNQEGTDGESVRKTIQLALIKGMKGSTQHQHVITPDSVAMFMGYFIQKLMKDEQAFRIFDPASGAANLLTTVMNQVKAEIQGYGSEIDPTLLQIAVASANLQQLNIEFFHQDSLQKLLLDPVDVVVADLPVGYYPDDMNASTYKLQAKEGHSYAHHLFIEQGMNYTKTGGYLLFLVPNFLFTSDQSEQLQEYLRENAHIIGFLQLPLSMFKSEQHGKSIFIIQKKGKGTKPPKETLMAALPSLKDPNKTSAILRQIDSWFQKEMG